MELKLNKNNIDQYFTFTDSHEILFEKYTYSIVVPIGIEKNNELRRFLSNIFMDVGENWDALIDNLSDFEQLSPLTRKIILFHQDLPISKDPQCVDYLDVIVAAKQRLSSPQYPEFLKITKDVKFWVIFPEHVKAEILDLVNKKKKEETLIT